jgi:hypothetical protein
MVGEGSTGCLVGWDTVGSYSKLV